MPDQDRPSNLVVRDTAIDSVVEWNYSSGSGPSGDGLLLEAGTDYLLLETSDFLLLE